MYLDFNILLFKKSVGDPTSIAPLECITVKDSLMYQDIPFDIRHSHVIKLRNKEDISAKVLWRSKSIEGPTLEYKQP